jgi:DNA-binding XRE family transcriptional regulator
MIAAVFARRFGVLLDSHRTDAAAVARAVGIAPSTTWRAAQGKHDPSLGTALAIADHFNVSLDWLCGRGRRR